jgi:8-oxo-dGTP pyrophosphatase MutT (NUDIX family)
VNGIPKIRHASRILLVDEFDRTFLFKGQDPQNRSDVFWCPVGGGIEPGETPEQAIRREVTEETGLVDFALGPHIWNREEIFSFNGVLLHAKETWFFSRVAHFEVDISGFSDIERETTLDQKWWTLQELADTPDSLTPRRLPELLGPLLKGHFPDTPLDLIHEESHL